MFLPFFDNLRNAGIPVSLREFLAFLEGMKKGLATYDIEAFYFLARTIMVKDERHLDKFDRAFAATFSGLDAIPPQAVMDAVDIPQDWLHKMAEKHLTDAQKAEIDSMGGFEKLMETLRERLAEQKGRHQGGSKWMGTAGTSPYGAYGYNPEGVRAGQDKSRHQRAVKVWDKREFRNLDDTKELGTRNIKVALKRSGAMRSRFFCFWMSAGPWTLISSWSRNCSVLQNPNSSIWNISISTTAFMKVCGATTAAVMTPKPPRQIFCGPMVRITNVSLWAMRRCRLMKSPLLAGQMNTCADLRHRHVSVFGLAHIQGTGCEINRAGRSGFEIADR